MMRTAKLLKALILSVLSSSLIPQIAQAQCAIQSIYVGYYQAKNYFGVAGCDGVSAQDKEIREVCRVALGAASRESLTYSAVLTGTFRSPGNNTHCYFAAREAGEQKVLSNAKAVGNPANVTNVQCNCVTPACADGIDNDGDGARDYPADTSCSSASDNDEANPRPQCQDGADNDGDGLTDLNDPGCSSNQGNNEGDGTSQCQDGIDNDNDGAADYPADFSCSSPQDRDESSPKAQCQDGIDNDNDGATDFPADASCSSPQDPDESSPRSQCQDGIDNDNDGAADYPADFSCSSSQDTDESSPKSQCQDGVDNDNDGVTDSNDPGCSSNQDNNEGDGTPQCRDGLDNDNDGAADYPADFSCSSALDNDEALPKASCQDGVDNDNDGMTDLNDPGCSSRQDDTEGDGTSQCQDGVDNDGDGAADFPADFSCSSPQDRDESSPKAQCQDGVDNDADGAPDLADGGCSSSQDNNEGDDSTRLSLSVECVMDNIDGSRMAYFSYNNTTQETFFMSVGSSGLPVVTNRFTSGAEDRGQPTAFAPGVQKGLVAISFSEAEITWTVRAPRSAESRATASASTPKCQMVEPAFSCRGFNNQVLTAKAGYSNPNPFPVEIPVGGLNFMAPVPAFRGQPSVFFSGLNPGLFNVTIPSTGAQVDWNLNGRKAVADESLPVCDGQCVDTAVGAARGELDEITVQLANLTKEAADVLEAASEEDSGSAAADAQRARAKADGFVAASNRLTIQFPDVIKNCPEAPLYCETVDRTETIARLKGLIASARNQAQRTIARAYFRKTGSTNRRDALVRKAKELERKGLDNLNKLPTTETVCK